jgi:hypothetical protein
MNDVPTCKCGGTMELDRSLKPGRVSGVGQKPQTVNVPFVCPTCRSRGHSVWDTTAMTQPIRDACAAAGLRLR